MADGDFVVKEAGRSSMDFETELQYFEEHRSTWIEHYEGKFALVKGKDLQGVYDTAEAAYQAGVELWGNVSFLIKQILPEDPIEQVPALMYGLLNAHT